MRPEALRILMIEGDPGDARLIEETLKNLPGRPVTLTRADCLMAGMAALERERFDAILLDLFLPDSSGEETVSRLVSFAPHTPVVVLTGTDDDELAVRVQKAGAQNYLVKGEVAGNHLLRAFRFAIERNRMVQELKTKTRELQVNEVLFRTIIEKNADAILILDGGRLIRFANPAAERLFGKDAKTLQGGHFGFRLDERDATEILIPRREGGETAVEMRLVRIEWKGQPAYLVTLRDVTESRRAREALRESEEQLRQSQKMEAIGRLAGGIAHDFNNLMTVVIGYSELALGRLPAGNEDVRKAIEEVRKSGERAARLTCQLLAFSRRQVLKPKVLNLNTVVSEMDKILRRLIGEHIELNTHLAEDLWSVKADPSQLEQVIINLAVNARDAMMDGGRLTLETANVELDEAYAEKRSVVSPGSYVMVAMSDTGHGIPTEIRERVFDPFFTTKETGQGTGLGLSTVYGIVKQSGGYVWVYSEVGTGTTFKIYLPRVLEKGEALTSSTRPIIARPGHETILVVEDEEAVRNLVSELLRSKGYRVLTARTGRDAVALFEGLDEPVHLVLTDVVMPGMSGTELARDLSSRAPGLKVVYMSGYTENAILHHGVIEPGTVLLQKPFHPNVLLSKVRDVLDGVVDEEA